MRLGALVVVSGPSGVGKDSLLLRLPERLGQDLLHRVTTATTRPMRPGDVAGVSYHFLERSEFERRVAADWFLEWARYGDHLYGTPADAVADARGRGRHVLIQIDVQGAEQVRRLAPDAALIFVAPPAMAAMRARLAAPGAEPRDGLEERLRRGRDEVAGARAFDYVIINDQLEQAADELAAVLRVVCDHPAVCSEDRALAEACSAGRRRGHLEALLAEA